MTGEPENLLPHRGPALLVDEVVRLDDGGVTVRCRLGADSAYAVGRRVPTIVTLDIAAQAAALLEAQGAAAAAGMLVRLREARIEVTDFSSGAEVSVRSERTRAQPPLYTYRATSRVGDALLAHFEFSLLTDPPPGEEADSRRHRATRGGKRTTGEDGRE